MCCGVIVVVDEHRCSNEMLARRTDGADARVLVTGFGAQQIFGCAYAFAPHFACVAEFNLVFADIEIGRLCCGAADDHAVVAGGFERRAKVATGGGSAQGIAGRWAEIDKAGLRTTRSKTSAGDRTGHADDDVLRIVRIDAERQFIEQNEFRHELSAPILPQQRLLGNIQVGELSCAQMNPQHLAHVAAGEARFTLTRKKMCVI
jgi:hypothetical protein